MKLAIVICLARVHLCYFSILVGGVCDLLNLENYSVKSFSHGNPRKISTSKIEHYTVFSFFCCGYYEVILQVVGCSVSIRA